MFLYCSRNAQASMKGQKMNEKEEKDRNKLTEGVADGDNQSTSNRPVSPSEPDPRIVALVQFLARRAAERDFRQLIEESRRNPDGDDQGRIQ